MAWDVFLHTAARLTLRTAQRARCGAGRQCAYGSDLASRACGLMAEAALANLATLYYATAAPCSCGCLAKFNTAFDVCSPPRGDTTSRGTT